jgi:hypothetical protein
MIGECIKATDRVIYYEMVVLRWLIGLFVVVAIGLVVVDRANAHDPNRPDLDNWFKGLRSDAIGLCCSGKDYKELDDSDWDTQDNHYRVRLDGKWQDVPANAVVKEKNRYGRALVWTAFSYGRNTITIRCFLPGTWS